MAPTVKRQPSGTSGRDVSADCGIWHATRTPLFWLAFLCAVIMAIAVLSATTHALVIGSDDRTELEDHEREEFRAIGLIASGKVPQGTAFLVCDCLTVVTAAHLALDIHGHPLNQDAEFLHDGHQGTPHLIDKAAMSLARSAKPGSYDPPTDWLIARLIRPVPDCRPLQYENSDRVEHWKKVSMIGFHSDLGAKRISKDCSISPVLSHKGLLVHMCDGTVGSSGSPLLFVDGSDLSHQARVVAIQSGEQRYLGFNVAVLFSEEFEKALGQFVTSCDVRSKIIAQRER